MRRGKRMYARRASRESLTAEQVDAFRRALVAERSGGGVGYVAGAGGAVTQLTSKSTGVTINKACGQITTHNAALGPGAEISFLVTNSAVGPTDVPTAVRASDGVSSAVSYSVGVASVAAGSFRIVISNLTAGSLSESLKINFAIIRAVAE